MAKLHTLHDGITAVAWNDKHDVQLFFFLIKQWRRKQVDARGD
jgi:hypothetical protein